MSEPDDITTAREMKEEMEKFHREVMKDEVVIRKNGVPEGFIITDTDCKEFNPMDNIAWLDIILFFFKVLGVLAFYVVIFLWLLGI